MDIFGAQTNRMRESIVKEVQAVHKKHVAGQHQIDPRGHRAYGNSIWDILPRRICEVVVEEFPAATAWKAQGASHSLPVFQGRVIVPWRIPGGRSVDDAEFLTSDARLRIVAGTEVPPQTLFDDFEDLPPEGESNAYALGISDFPGATILVAVESNTERLHKIFWGEVKQDEEKQLVWLSKELIYTAEETTSDVTQVPSHTFSDGALPTPIVQSRTESGGQR